MDGMSLVGLVFEACGELWAFDIEYVEKVARAVAVREIPDAPDGVIGVIGFWGKFIALYDFRRLFRCSDKQLGCEDRFVILRHEESHLAVVVDEVIGVLELEPVMDKQAERVLSSGTGPVKAIAVAVQKLPQHHDSSESSIKILDARWFFQEAVSMDLLESFAPDKDFG